MVDIAKTLSLKELRDEYKKLYPRLYGPKDEHYEKDKAFAFQIVDKQQKRKMISLVKESWRELGIDLTK